MAFLKTESNPQAGMHLDICSQRPKLALEFASPPAPSVSRRVCTVPYKASWLVVVVFSSLKYGNAFRRIDPLWNISCSNSDTQKWSKMVVLASLGCGHIAVHWVAYRNRSFAFTAQEARSPKSSSWQRCAPSEGSGRELVPCFSPSFWWWLTVLGVWGLDTHRSSHGLSSQGFLPCVSVPLRLSLLKRTPFVGYRAHPNLIWLYLNLIRSAKTLFLNKVIGVSFRT